MHTVFEGFRFVDFSQGMAGAMATMIFSDNGGEVIKVEPPAGDWARALPGFRMWNRGKQSVLLDLRKSDARRQARSLVASADVVVESFPDSAATKFGLDYASLRRDQPNIVACSISGFGRAKHAEQLRYYSAYDGLIMAKSGRMMGLDKMSGACISDANISATYIPSSIGSFGAAMLVVRR